jgi:pre-mRNA-splicing factor CDC5/CEF1
MCTFTPTRYRKYEQMLDAAARDGDGGDAAAAAMAAQDDPRRLRPGEIDPTPEARPARPDAIDST